jgi:hypothetical protein
VRAAEKYQITAVVLTYAAVSLAAVPVIISYARSHRDPQNHQQVQQQQANSVQFKRNHPVRPQEVRDVRP